MLGADPIPGAIFGNGDTTVNKTKPLPRGASHRPSPTHDTRVRASVSDPVVRDVGQSVPLGWVPGQLTSGKEDGAAGTALPSLDILGCRKEVEAGLRAPCTVPAGTGATLFS